MSLSASVGRQIKFYNKPLLTAGGFSYDFIKPKRNFDDEFHMLVNAGYNFQHMGEFLFEKVFQRYIDTGYIHIYETERIISIKCNLSYILHKYILMGTYVRRYTLITVGT